MDQLEPYQLWFVIAAVGYIGFLVGRASRSVSAGQNFDERQLQYAQEAEHVFSQLSPEAQNEVDAFLASGRIIEAIKLIREESDAGLREARLVAEHRRRHMLPA